MESILPAGGYSYAPNYLLALIFAVLCLLFALMRRRTGRSYFLWLSAATLLGAIGQGTTSLQNPSVVYANWTWWWSQPLVAGALVCLSVGLIQYLPLSEVARRRLAFWLIALPAIHVVGTAVLLMLGIPVVRIWALTGILPPIVLASAAALYCEKREPWMGHGLIGLTLLAVPVIIASLILTGATTAVVRVWTGLPAVVILLIMMSISLLREWQRLQAEVAMRAQAELKAQEAASQLEMKVRERTLDLQELVQGLEAFNRNISHDLRSPLGSIDMLAHMAQQFITKGDTPSALEQLVQITQLVRSSHQKVDALLSLARASNEPIRKQPTDLTAVADSALREALLAQGLAAGAPGVPALRLDALGDAVVDARLLHLALVNLLSNALKFNRGQQDCSITVGRDDGLTAGLGQFRAQAQGQPCLFVKDTGVGFKTGPQSDPFAPFKRMSSAGQASGHGIGLSIVHRIIERHGGQVWLQSEPGKGTTVFMTLGSGA